MSGEPRVAVLAGDDAGAAQQVAGLVSRVVTPAEHPTPEELGALAGRATVAWIPPLSALEPGVLEALRRWCTARDAAVSAGPGGAAAERCEGAASGAGLQAGRATAPGDLVWARPWLLVDGAELPLERRIVLSAPGAVRLHGGELHPAPGARGVELDARWVLRPPAHLADHLAAVNAQSGHAARLLFLAGAEPTLRSLALRPCRSLVRSLAGVRGERRLALPRAVLEAYRDVLTAAKLWELGHPDAMGSR